MAAVDGYSRLGTNGFTMRYTTLVVTAARTDPA
jgi:hypothetical protein